MRSCEQPLRTSVVPSTELQSPGRSAPAAICAAQPSVMPAMTAAPSGSPVSAAASAQSSPSRVPGATTSGSRWRTPSIPAPAKHRRAAS
jgi:hypothetical protein